jgi:hypothetical protein
MFFIKSFKPVNGTSPDTTSSGFISSFRLSLFPVGFVVYVPALFSGVVPLVSSVLILFCVSPRVADTFIYPGIGHSRRVSSSSVCQADYAVFGVFVNVHFMDFIINQPESVVYVHALSIRACCSSSDNFLGFFTGSPACCS